MFSSLFTPCFIYSVAYTFNDTWLHNMSPAYVYTVEPALAATCIRTPLFIYKDILLMPMMIFLYIQIPLYNQLMWL